MNASRWKVYFLFVTSMLSHSEERHQDEHEELPDEALQRDEDHAEDRRHDQHDEDQEAVALEPRVGVGHLRRQELHEHVRAVERRQRDHVEDREVDVVDDDELEDLVDADAQVAHRALDDEQRDEREEGRHEVGKRPCERDEDIVAARLLEVARVDDDGLGPAEAHEEQHDEADRVDVRSRVQRQAPHEERRPVAQGNGDARMRVLVDDHRDDQARDAGDEVEQVEIKHIDSFESPLLLRLLCGFLLRGEHQDGDDGLRIDDAAVRGHGDGFCKRHLDDVDELILIRVLLARRQALGRVEVDLLVREADRRRDRRELRNVLRRVAGLLRELALGADERVLVRRIELAGRHLERHRIDRIAVLAHEDDAAVRQERDDGRGARMLNPLTRRLFAVRQLDRVALDVKQDTVEDSLAVDFLFDQILIHTKNPLEITLYLL